MNPHFVEMLRALSEAGAEFLVIGAHALAAHGHVRATRDLDLWIRPTSENAARVWRALVEFGAPLEDITLDELTTPGIVFQIGIEPIRIDLLTSPSGLEFGEAWNNRVLIEISGQVHPFLSREDLIRTKRAAGRPQDLADIDALERL